MSSKHEDFILYYRDVHISPQYRNQKSLCASLYSEFIHLDKFNFSHFGQKDVQVSLHVIC